MKITAKILTILGILTAWTFYAYAQEISNIYPVYSKQDTVIWLIKPAPVGDFQTAVPNIRFQLYDEIKITAGGKVSTLDPESKKRIFPDYSNSITKYTNRLFYGTIWIPGLTAHLIPTRSLFDRNNIITGYFSDPSQMYLRLGYLSDNYDMTNYQDIPSKDTAWIQITIIHHPSNPQLGNIDKSMDLLWDSTDVNGLPLNPYWFIQKTVADGPTRIECFDSKNNFEPRNCTNQQLLIDEKDVWCCICPSEQGKVYGHFNWGLVQVNGNTILDGYENYTIFHDHDFNYEMTTPKQNGVTRGNENKKMHLEFAGNETSSRFRKDNWWNNYFNDAANIAHFDTAPRRTKAIGLLGIDNVHRDQAEIHPVYLYASEIASKIPNTEKWAFFARSTGDEGKCSSFNHFVVDTALSFSFEGCESIDFDHSLIYQINKNIDGKKFISENTAANTLRVRFKLLSPNPDPLSQNMFFGILCLKKSSLPIAAKAIELFPEDEKGLAFLKPQSEIKPQRIKGLTQKQITDLEDITNNIIATTTRSEDDFLPAIKLTSYINQIKFTRNSELNVAYEKYLGKQAYEELLYTFSKDEKEKIK